MLIEAACYVLTAGYKNTEIWHKYTKCRGKKKCKWHK